MNSYTKAALVADALNLGPHWVYNQDKLARIYSDGVYTLTDPASSYHPNRSAGQLTHLGDQTYFLAQSIEGADGVFDLNLWRDFWLEKISHYDGYMDHSMKVTLEQKGMTPSDSDEVSGAARLAALLDLPLDLEEMILAARQQASLTHGAPEVSELAEFVVRAVFHIREGVSIPHSLEQAALDGEYHFLDPLTYLQKAKEADPSEHLTEASEFGLTCHLKDAFPLILYYAFHLSDSFEEALSRNALAGGDNTARAIILSTFFVARDGDVGAALFPKLRLEEKEVFKPGSNSLGIQGERGLLSGVLEMPDAPPIATAIFAHCFTCGKDFLSGKRLSSELAKKGIATLRIDFSGIGQSEGDFVNSSFLTNVSDLVSASQWLESHLESPQLLVGHSLGGAAALVAAGQVSSVKAVATVGAPADPAHVTHLFEDRISEIREKGKAEVILAGRTFTIGEGYLKALEDHNQQKHLRGLDGVHKLILHSPQDEVVSLENAGVIYSALSHPKSFIALDRSDHLLTKKEDSKYVAEMIAMWAFRALGK